MKILIFFMLLARYFGWLLAIVTVAAHFNHYEATWTYPFSKETLVQNLFMAAFFDLLYQNAKLHMIIRELKK